MGVVMDMSSYEIESDPLEMEYGEEVLCSGWNPAIAQMCQQAVAEQVSRRPAIPAELATVDVESFLQKMYACQR